MKLRLTFFILSLFCIAQLSLAQKKTLKSAQKAFSGSNYKAAIGYAEEASEHPETKDNATVYTLIAKSNTYLFSQNKTEFKLAEKAYINFRKAIELGGDKVYQELMEEVVLNNDGSRLGGGEGFKFLQQLLNIQGNELFQRAQYENAYQYFNLSTQITPNDVVMNFYAGYCAYQSDSINDIAIAYYEKVIALNDDLPAEEKFQNVNFAYNGLIDIYFSRKEDFDNALKYIRKAKEVFPEELTYEEYEIDVLIRANKMGEAIEGLEAVVQTGKATEFTFYRLAYLQWNNEQFDEALVSAEKALEINPTYYDALYVAGSVVFNQATTFLKEANNTDPSDTEGYDNLIAQAKQTFKKALPYFERAVKEKPEDMYTLNPLSTIYDQLDMDDRRDEILKRIRDLEGR